LTELENQIKTDSLLKNETESLIRKNSRKKRRIEKYSCVAIKSRYSSSQCSISTSKSATTSPSANPTSTSHSANSTKQTTLGSTNTKFWANDGQFHEHTWTLHEKNVGLFRKRFENDEIHVFKSYRITSLVQIIN